MYHLNVYSILLMYLFIITGISYFFGGVGGGGVYLVCMKVILLAIMVCIILNRQLSTTPPAKTICFYYILHYKSCNIHVCTAIWKAITALLFLYSLRFHVCDMNLIWLPYCFSFQGNPQSIPARRKACQNLIGNREHVRTADKGKLLLPHEIIVPVFDL